MGAGSRRARIPDHGERWVVGAPASRQLRRRTQLLALCIGTTAVLLTAPAPASADHDVSQLELVGQALQQATDTIELHHDGTDFEIAQSPQTQPAR